MKRQTAFSNQIVWITGASSGIGEALALRFAEAGARLVLSGRNVEALEGVRERCDPRSDPMVLPLDLSEWTALGEKAAAVLDRFGHVDILVNNGGITHRGLALETKLEVDKRIMDVDYFGQIALTKAVLPSMVERRSGHIVVTTSVAGVMPAPWRTAYCGAKHALHGFFEALRLEIWRENIRITMVCPGPVRTRVSLNALTGTGEPYGKMDPLISSGLSADACARAILNGVARGKMEVIVAKPPVKLAVRMRRHLPGLFFRMMKNRKAL